MMFNLNYLIFLLCFVSLEAVAQTQLGKTYGISESDALSEVNNKAQSFQGIKDVDIDNTTAFKGFPLPVSKRESTTLVSPFYTLEFDITDNNGQVIYPKGFVYNVAEYVQLPFRVMVFNEQQVEYVKRQQKPTDILLLSEGDIFSVKNSLDGNVFYLDERLADRLYVKSVPSIVKQVGAQYEISEVYLGGK